MGYTVVICFQISIFDTIGNNDKMQYFYGE